MNRTEKAAVIDRLRTELADVPAIVVTDFKGLNVESVDALRSALRKAEVKYEVVKNTLARAAVAGTAKENMAELLKGNSAIAYHAEDPALPAKSSSISRKTTKTSPLRGMVDGGLDENGVTALSKLPGKDELRAKILGLLTAAPTKFVRTVVAAPTTFVQVLRARELQLGE